MECSIFFGKKSINELLALCIIVTIIIVISIITTLDNESTQETMASLSLIQREWPIPASFLPPLDFFIYIYSFKLFGKTRFELELTNDESHLVETQFWKFHQPDPFQNVPVEKNQINQSCSWSNFPGCRGVLLDFVGLSC